MPLAHKINLAGILVTGAVLLQACQTVGSYTGLNNETKAFTASRDIHASDWIDPDEVKRTWLAALVRIPSGDGSFIETRMRDGDKQSLPAGKRYPTVIHLHGCGGIGNHTVWRLDLYARNGFAAIAPASFARKKYAQSCDSSIKRHSMYRRTGIMRRIDAGYAIEMAKKLPWVDPDNVFLTGFSQGGVVAATFVTGNRNQSVRARVIEGPHCHYGWSDARGLKAPKSEPVLSLASAHDPWHAGRKSDGFCDEFMHRSNGSRSILYRDGPLSTKHDLLSDSDVQKIVIEFLKDRVATAAARRPEFDPREEYRNDGRRRQELTKKEIRELLAGNTLTFRSRRRNGIIWIYFAEDGSTLQKIEGTPRLFRKKWFINSRRRLCRTVGAKNRTRCREVEIVGAARLELTNRRNSTSITATVMKGRQLPD